MLKEKPELVRNFVAATLKGWNTAIAAPEEAAKITVKYGDKLTYDHELAMMKASVPLLKPDSKPVGYMDEAGWSSAQKLLLAAGFQKASRSTSPRPSPRKRCRIDTMNAIVLTDRLEAAPIAPSKPILSIEDLNVRFGSVVAVESLSLTVRRGEFVSLLGPSGCGKSTLLKAIAGLVRPTGGRITRSETDLRTGFMFQKPLLLPWRTTLDNVLLPIEIQRGGNAVDSAERRRTRCACSIWCGSATSRKPIRTNYRAACSSGRLWPAR